MDVYPGVKSWGFQGSHYSSPYFSFAALDAGSSYPSVLPQPERRLLSTYDKPPWGYPLDRTCAGQAALHGRLAGGRSRVGG
jgi:hypothetical protein